MGSYYFSTYWLILNETRLLFLCASDVADLKAGLWGEYRKNICQDKQVVYLLSLMMQITLNYQSYLLIQILDLYLLVCVRVLFPTLYFVISVVIIKTPETIAA